MKKSDEEFRIKITGHIKIFEYENPDQVGSDNGRLVLNKMNAIHPENASIMVARAIANRENGTIYTMHFGSGGATIDPLGNVVYQSTNTTGSADLHTPEYFEVVDDTDNAPPGNQMAVRHVSGQLFSDVEIRCVIDKSEPFGQSIVSNASGHNMNSSGFIFDEIGLKTEDGLLVTHAVHSPIEKSSDRIFEIVYTLRIRIT